MFAGLIRDDERVLVEGVPGLSDLPGIGRLFAHTQKEAQETDILLTLTPHVVRVLDLSESDLRPFRLRTRRAGAARRDARTGTAGPRSAAATAAGAAAGGDGAATDPADHAAGAADAAARAPGAARRPGPAFLAARAEPLARTV